MPFFSLQVLSFDCHPSPGLDYGPRLEPLPFKRGVMGVIQGIACKNGNGFMVAEREGFEPSVPLMVVHAISSRAPSANSDISPIFNILSGFVVL